MPWHSWSASSGRLKRPSGKTPQTCSQEYGSTMTPCTSSPERLHCSLCQSSLSVCQSSLSVWQSGSLCRSVSPHSPPCLTVQTPAHVHAQPASVELKPLIPIPQIRRALQARKETSPPSHGDSNPSDDHRNRFVVSFGGTSITAGHDNYHNQSYPFVFHRLLRSPFKKAGVSLTVRNVAQGASPPLPTGLCVGEIFGSDVDVVSLEMKVMFLASPQRRQRLSEAPRHTSEAAFTETFLRQALLLPKQVLPPYLPNSLTSLPPCSLPPISKG